MLLRMFSIMSRNKQVPIMLEDFATLFNNKLFYQVTQLPWICLQRGHRALITINNVDCGPYTCNSLKLYFLVMQTAGPEPPIQVRTTVAGKGLTHILPAKQEQEGLKLFD